jgi:predicted nuclease of predicted toxin-antitoxin system
MTARLLLNENFPAPATAVLRRHGVDLVALGEVSPGMSDAAVIEWATRDRRWTVTFDRDYGELVYHQRIPPPPVIVLLRERHYRPDEPAGWIIELLRTPQQFIGKFVVFSRRSVRTRPLPLSAP